MTEPIIHEVLEATGYLANGRPAHGVSLDAKSDEDSRFRDFSPDAVWRSASALTVYFKYEREEPLGEKVASWQREVWNQGFAPLLWVISPENIKIYNGFSRPREESSAAVHLLDTFGRIEKELDRLDAFAGRLVMETGEFWHQAQSVHRKTCVDQQLLSDLAVLEQDLLSAGLDRSSVQSLIGRSIFAQYLIDRKIVKRRFLQNEYGHEILSRILRDRKAVKRFFDWLRDTFNGDMFPANASFLPKAQHLRRVADFLDAVDPVSGQTTLFPYQFDVIPVELISSIYEQFAHTVLTSDDETNEVDVHYTRLSLVSLVLDEVMDGLSGEETVLDLSCGSGVFLVEALRKLVKRRCNDGRPSRSVIRSVLHDQIYGIDISEAAVRVAAFSLYLAALELDPDTRSPKALGFKPLIGKTLIVGDSRNIESTLEGKRALMKANKRKAFDVIVGNPPWSYRGKAAREIAPGRERERFRSPRGVSLDFVLRALDFASDESRLGMVLSSIQFFSRSKTGLTMLRSLLERLSSVTLVNLSYQSSWLFPQSRLPAMVLLARHRPSARDEITVVQVPWSPAGAQSHAFEIAHEDIAAVSVSDWLRKPEFLKATFFGSGRDLSLLDRLTGRHESLREQFQALGTKFHSGLIYGNRSIESHFLHGLPVITKADVQPFSVSENLELFDSDYAERPRARKTYQAPLLLVREFLQTGGRAVCAVAERDVVFPSTFRGASIPRESLGIAHLTASILSSSLASWFFLMTGSTFGLSMPRLLLRDIEHIPVPALEDAYHSSVGQRLIDLGQRQGASQITDGDWHEIDEAVFDLYELDDADRIIARDGLVRAGWQWKASRVTSTKPAEMGADMLTYSEAFLSALNVWLVESKRHRMSGEVFDFPANAPYRVVRFVLEEGTVVSPPRVIETQGRLRDVLNRIGNRLNERIGESLVGQRTLRVYGQNEIIIVKPAAKRHWMGVSALNDADAVVSDSVAGFTE